MRTPSGEDSALSHREAPEGAQDSLWDHLYARYHGLVFAVALAEVSHWADAEDVAQRVFVRAWRSRESFDPVKGGVRSWLLAITRNVISDLRAARTRERSLREAVASVAGFGEAGRGGGEVEEDVVNRLLVTSELDRLAEHQRLVVELAFFANLTHSEIAEDTGLPIGTVKSQLRRALHRLRGRRACLAGSD
ncbi:RNA polymerase sigma factor [Saccharomonospora xinjiangensis]|uniref:RNA polymerase sigma factor n=1 Tax=Saccharomonospora xinjiangensis TaxID=75294 RepID=UPI00350F97B7